MADALDTPVIPVAAEADLATPPAGAGEARAKRPAGARKAASPRAPRVAKAKVGAESAASTPTDVEAPFADAPIAATPAAPAPVAKAPLAATPVAATPAASAPIAEAPVAAAPAADAPTVAVPAAPARKRAARPRTARTAPSADAKPAPTAVGTAKAGARTLSPRVVTPKPRLPRTGKRILDGLGVPVFGARHGAPDVIDWSGLADEYRRHPVTSFLRHKRWIYATATTDRLLVVAAIVDGAITGTAFIMVTDIVTGEVLADSSRPGGNKPLIKVNDHPLDGLEATYRLPGTYYRISREAGSNETHVHVRLRSAKDSLPGLRSIPGIRKVPVLRNLPTASDDPWLELDLTLESSVAPALTAVSPVEADGGLVTSTVKTAAMNTWGTLTLHGETPSTHSLDGGTGGTDYTNGFLPRRTHWQWAFATGRLSDGRLFGLNLVSDFAGIGDDAAENCVWLDGALYPLDSRARVIVDRANLHQALDRPYRRRCRSPSLRAARGPRRVPEPGAAPQQVRPAHRPVHRSRDG